jgi:mono/diheme cytochrome c family protein
VLVCAIIVNAYQEELSTMVKQIARVCVVSLLAIGTMSFAQKSGADTYKSKCQSCHAADGSGSTPAGKAMKALPFNSPDIVNASDADLIADTQNGKGKMPAYKGKLTDDQIKDVVAYIRTLQKK